jgi:hypothetical protein
MSRGVRSVERRRFREAEDVARWGLEGLVETLGDEGDVVLDSSFSGVEKDVRR